jgi:glutamate--cysteine ligase
LTNSFSDRIKKLSASNAKACLWGGLKGIEKESLRIRQDGSLSASQQPLGLGSALTNKYITTDFSEALLEFVTPALPTTWEALRFLCDVHQFTYNHLDDELLWVTSMPCVMAADGDIPLAQYGSSNVGRMKTIYRNGLGYRYGRKMQTIAGIHFNYSLPESFWPVFKDLEQLSESEDVIRSEAYLGLLRNYRRIAWIILYLFGASPALCKSFASGSDISMPSYDKNTFYQPFGTSLRMSDLGYSNNSQAGLNISLNNLNDYISDLSAAISTPVPEFEKIGVKVDGEYRQLSVNQLQIENEYYSSIRPKRVAHSGERPTAALRRGGIEYVEVRSLDLNIFDPVGISQNTMRFVEALLVYCLLEDSPSIDDAEIQEAGKNHSLTATTGRDPELMLSRQGQPISLKQWAGDILNKVEQVAELIDSGSERDDYVQTVKAQASLIADPELTPSARILQDLRNTGNGFFHYALDIARKNQQYFAALEVTSDEQLKTFEEEAADSIKRQADIEASDTISLDEYIHGYFSS